MQSLHASLQQKLGLKEKFEDFSKYNLDPHPHGMAHDLEITLLASNEQSFECFGSQVEKDLC